MAIDVIHAFYCSKAFADLSRACKIASGGVCSRCGEVFNMSELRPHHKIELTLENVSIPAIALNQDNIEVLCHNCHNQVHRRFGGASEEKKVFIVYGSPCSGKNEYVETVATRNDLVVDLDKIHRSLCICEMHDKPDSVKSLAFRIRDMLIDHIRTAGKTRKWQNAYIIGTYPNKYERERMQKELQAELIFIDTSKEECVKRARVRHSNNTALADAVVGWIEKWWGNYTV